MAKTVIGVFRSSSNAEKVADELKTAGFAGEDIHVMAGTEFLDSLREEYPATEGGVKGGLHRLMRKLGMGDGEYSTTNVEPDDTVLMVDTEDDRAGFAAELMNRRDVIDIDTRKAAPKEVPTAPEGPAEGKIPVVEEDREVSAGEMGAFKEGEIEVTATSEEPVISKQARVKEEVTVGKTTEEKPEIVRERLRGTEVEVEQLSADEESDFSAQEPELRTRTISTYGGDGPAYDELRPFVRYGYHLGHDPRFHDGDWSSVEPMIKSDWDTHHYGPWDRYEKAVRSGWEASAHR